MMYKTNVHNRTGWIRSATAGLAAVGVALALAGCGGPPAPESGAANGTITVGLSVIPATLDPGQVVNGQAQAIRHLIAGTLTSMPNGKDITMELAASVEPEGEKRFVVKLKPDLKFSDGSSLKATDVAASFEYYLADKSNLSGYLITSIAKVTAVDDLTVNFDLKQSYPSLPAVLSYAPWEIIPAKTIEAKGKDLYKGDPLPSAGQFQVKSLGTDQITLTANPNYAGTQPTTKTLVFKKINDPAARLAQLQGGQIDFAHDIGPKAVGQLSEPLQVRTTLNIIGNIFLYVNTRPASVLSDVRIRQAIAVAVDRNQINDVAFAGKNKPSVGILANSSKYNQPFLSASPDIGRAKELLAGTKCESGCSVDVLVKSSSDAFNDTAVVMQQNLKAIGVQSNIEKVEPSTLEQRKTEGSFDLVVDNNYDNFDYPDGIFTWSLGTGNASGYLSPEMQAFVDQVNTTSGSAKDSAVAQARALFEKDLPYIPLVDLLVVSGSRVSSSAFDFDPTYYFHVG